MKKVWILEKFIPADEARKSIEFNKELMVNPSVTDEVKFGIEQAIKVMAKRLEETPEGYWIGWEGKTVYRQFCDVAKAALRRADKSWKFRVVEGEIEDDAKYWVGYTFVKVNEGVLRYLMATK